MDESKERLTNYNIIDLTQIIMIFHAIRLLHLACQDPGKLCATLYYSRLFSVSGQVPVHIFHFNYMDSTLR